MRTLKGFLYLILGGTLCGWMFNRIAAWFIDNPLTVGSNHTVAEWAVILQDPFYLDSRTMPFFFLAFGALALVTMTKYDWTGEREEQKKLRKARKAVEECERKIARLEARVKELDQLFLDPAKTSDMGLVTEYADTRRQLDELQDEWLVLAEAAGE